ncbi:MAG: SRPBCC domain-containing protein [Halioglobus sp.]
MNTVLKKRIWAYGLLLGIGAMYFVDSDWEVSHQISVAASPSVVWEVLVDLDLYPEWNRYSPIVRGRVAVGEVIWVEAHLDNEIQHVQNIVMSVKPNQELCWQSTDWYGFLASGTRCRWLSAAEDGETLLVHHEVMSGPLAWLIKLIYRDRIERGLKLVDESIAERAEFLAATTDTAAD